jgi:S-adenosylmethionine/arginine decarboxylase-like enzyme
MLQYHINRNDHYQQLLLVTGLAAGLLLSPSVPFSVPESPVSLHTFAVTTSVALACSACGHWIWRTFFTTRDARLERKIQEWREDARGMVKERPVIRLAELV